MTRQNAYWWCERESKGFTMKEGRSFDWLVKPEAVFVLCPGCGDALLRRMNPVPVAPDEWGPAI